MRTTVRTSRNSAVTLGPVGVVVLAPFLILWLILVCAVWFCRAVVEVIAWTFTVSYTVWRTLHDAERAVRGWLARP